MIFFSGYLCCRLAAQMHTRNNCRKSLGPLLSRLPLVGVGVACPSLVSKVESVHGVHRPAVPQFAASAFYCCTFFFWFLLPFFAVLTSPMQVYMQSSAPNPTQPAHIPQGGLASSVLFGEGAGLGPEPPIYASGTIHPDNKVLIMPDVL